MFTRLVLITFLLVSARSSLAESFSKTRLWKNYLFFKNGSFKVKGDRFYISSKKTLKAEFEESTKLLSGNKKDQEGEYYHCQFPARYMILEKHMKISSDLLLCDAYNAFKRGLDIQDVFLVFTSAYPNNPASMFGHTFLRFSRKSRGELESTKELIGYSAAFQAQTNPNDNPFQYTFKGLLGGYLAYPEIKPQYLNIGIYNNGESRDLWEFQLNLSTSEKELLTALLWELSHSGAFNYYFFDENCSTFLLYLLEIIRPEIEYDSLKQTFVVPQTTYKELFVKFNGKSSKFRASLAKKITNQYRALNKNQKIELIETLEGSYSQDVKVLDIAVDFWKYKNYQTKSNLSQDQKNTMFETYRLRALAPVSSHVNYETPIKESPELGHDQSLIGVGVSNNGIVGRIRYGFHDFKDPNSGYDRKSYINFLDYNHSEEFKKIQLAQITSLQDYNNIFKNFSWSSGLSFENIDQSSLTEFFGGIGFSKTFKKLQVFSFVTGNYINYKIEKRLLSGIYLGVRFDPNDKLRFISKMKAYTSRFSSEFELSLLRDTLWGSFSLDYLSQRELPPRTSFNYHLYF